MDIYKFLGYTWMYLYPLLLISSFIVITCSLVGFDTKKIYWFRIFSSIFLSLISVAFIYYLYYTHSISDSYTLYEVIINFYSWAVFLAFYILLSSIIIVTSFYVYKLISKKARSS